MADAHPKAADDQDPHDGFRVAVQSGPLAVREALDMVISALVSMSLGVEESGTIEFVLAEVLNNVVEHASSEGSEPGQTDNLGRA